MIAKRVIARLDIKTDNVVKGVRMEGLRIVGAPSDLAKKYDKQGIDELLYIDTVASLYGRNHLEDVIKLATEECMVPITVGGGVRSVDTMRQLIRNGADKVAINTFAFERPEILSEAANIFGSQAVVLSIQAKREGNDWVCYAENGRERVNKLVLDWAQEAESLGVGEILLTSIDRDGTGLGFDLDLARQVVDRVSIPVVISGGAGEMSEMLEAFQIINLSGIALASVLHFDKFEVGQIKTYLSANGINIRSNEDLDHGR